MALEDYDSILRQCYAKVAEHTERRNEDARAAFAAAGEDAHAPADISEKVAETSVAIARRLAERPMMIHG